MKTTRYLALLRGINVGGNNIIRMTDLKACFEELGFHDVKTYIQSGNVLFSSGDKDMGKLTIKIEKALSVRFNYQSKLVVVSQSQLNAVVLNAPESYGLHPDEYRYDVVFLKAPLTVEVAFDSLKLREGVDQAYKGDGVLYLSRLMSRAGQSYITKMISLPIYKNMTIRNWNTTSKLREIM